MGKPRELKKDPTEESRPKRAPVWIIQLVALLLLGFFVWLEATHGDFSVSPFVWGILGSAILPPEILSRWPQIVGLKSKGD